MRWGIEQQPRQIVHLFSNQACTRIVRDDRGSMVGAAAAARQQRRRKQQNFFTLLDSSTNKKKQNFI
jgi:hypothetical protein